MKHLFADYDVSLLVKEKGYNKQCLAFYNGKLPDGNWSLELIDTDFINFRKINSLHVSAPLWDQIIDWLRTKYKLIILVLPQEQSICYPEPLYFIAIQKIIIGECFEEVFNSTNINTLIHYETMYDARRAAILHALTLI